MEKIESLSIKKDKLEQEVERLKEKKQNIGRKVISAESAFSALQIVNKQFPKLELRQKKRLLYELIKRIVVYKNRVVVEYLGIEDEEKDIGSSKRIGGSDTVLSGGEGGI